MAERHPLIPLLAPQSTTARRIGAFQWVGVLIVATAPGVIALDSGGVFPWSYWAAAAAVLLPTLLAAGGLLTGEVPRGWQPHLLTLALLGLGLYAALQMLPLPSGVVRWLAPGSHAAWTEWLPSDVSPERALGGRDAMPISVAPDRTQAYVWFFVTCAAFAWCGAMLLRSRIRLMWFLALMALLGSVHVLLGLWQVFLFPNQTVWGASAGHPFGVFVNRNNAAALFNLSLACSLGLIGWRLAAVTGHEFGQRGFSLSVVLDLISDRPAILALSGVLLNLVGILACGSRGGMAGCIAGMVLGLGLLSSTRLFGRLLIILLASLLAGLALLARFDVSPRTLERFGASAEGFSESILADSRLPHWSDSLNAASHYLPSGAGFGTYRYAYLPYELGGVEYWFVNADNLWLEWLVEGGVVAMILMVVVAGAFLWALLQLRETADPLDHGLATAGWFTFGAIGVSQFFDFGLLLAGTAIGVSVLGGAVLGRAASVGVPLIARPKKAGDRIAFHDTSATWGVRSLAVVLLIAVSVAVSQLAGIATADAIARQGRMALRSADAAAIRAAVSELKQYEEVAGGNAELAFVAASLKLELAQQQLGDALASKPSLANQGELATVADPIGFLRRLQSEIEVAEGLTPADRGELQRSIEQLLSSCAPARRDAIDDAIASLGRSPLASEPRLLLLKTGVEHGSSERVETLQRELFALRRGTTTTLRAMATFAAQRRDWETYSEALRRMIKGKPKRAVSLFREAERRGHPSALEAIPNEPQAIEAVAKYLIRSGRSELPFYRRAIESLSVEFPEDRRARAERYLLLARMHDKLGQFDEAEQAFSRAIELRPMQAEFRTAYAWMLGQAGKPVEGQRYLEGLLNEQAAFGDEKTLGREQIQRGIKRLQPLIDRRNQAIRQQ